MKTGIKKSLLSLFCIVITQIALAQPPPPHPGGSGNQGAALEWIVLFAILLIYFGIRHKRRLDT